MKFRKRRDDEPQPTQQQIVAEAKSAFEAVIPGVGICEHCWQPTSSKAHRKRCGS